MKFLADEGIDKPIVDLLRSENFDVVYILETYRGMDDDLIMAKANAEERVLLTQDKDFGELVFRLKQVHHGVILIRLEGYNPQAKASIVLNVIRKHNTRLKNSFAVIQPNAIRIRK